MKKPSEIEDYFERLGISRSATEEEIKKAYRGLAMDYHPDKNGESEESRLEFIAVGEAYEKVMKKGKNYSGEKDYDYFENLFGITFEDINRISKTFSESDDERVRYFGDLIKRTLGSLL